MEEQQMWRCEHAAEAEVDPAQVWRRWTDVEAWPTWNPDLRQAEISGGFVPGSEIAMTLGSGDVITLELTDVEEGTSFVDEARMDGVVVKTTHRLDSTGATSFRVVYDIAVTGDLPDEELAAIGQSISADFPETIAGLLAAST